MAYVEFITAVHRSTPRDYLGRVNEADKAACAEAALKWDREYWDGDRKTGYGGYRYDGRWRKVASDMAAHYRLRPGARILDVGCGKGFLLHDFASAVSGARVTGVDISAYGLANAKEEVRPFLARASAAALPFPDRSFDFVVSVNALHNLYNYELYPALREIERVAAGPKHIIIETYRNEREKVNLLYWQLTCRAFLAPREWEWLFEHAGYTGDWSAITFQ